MPFKRGQRVVIPAGVEVASTRSRNPLYKTVRAQTVVIHHFMPGMSIIPALDGKRWHNSPDPSIQAQFAEYERLVEQRRSMFAGTRTWEEIANKCFNFRIHVMNPTVCWVGQGGYWCEVDINDILDANGIRRGRLRSG